METSQVQHEEKATVAKTTTQESVDQSEPSMWGRFINSVEKSLELTERPETTPFPEPTQETKPSLWERYLAIEAELDIPIVEEFLEDEYDSEDGADFPAPC